jgi:prolyl oligopeptidase
LRDTHLQEYPRMPFEIESTLAMVRSHDGTSVPISIAYRKGLKLDASHPALVWAYGAYGTEAGTPAPFFDPRSVAWMERGGIVAVAHVRGGGEYGDDWHRAGMKATKPNSWMDLIACAEYLIERKYTTRTRLGITGQSAGGIVIGRAITARPDLFAAAVSDAGLSEMVRFELTPNGPGNIREFGTVKIEEEFRALYEMSPYHHVQNGVAYPAVLLTAGMNDKRVVAWQPAKFAARLQAATSGSRPILLSLDFDAGHGIGTGKSQSQEALADKYAFLLWQFGEPDFQFKDGVQASDHHGALPASRR